MRGLKDRGGGRRGVDSGAYCVCQPACLVESEVSEASEASCRGVLSSHRSTTSAAVSRWRLGTLLLAFAQARVHAQSLVRQTPHWGASALVSAAFAASAHPENI